MRILRARGLGLVALLAAGACRKPVEPPPPAPVVAPAPPPAPVPPPPPAPAEPVAPVLLYVKIPEAPGASGGSEKYRAPIDELVRGRGLGSVAGGGTIVARSKHLAYVSLDVQVTDVSAALPLVQAKLRELGAPRGSVIEEGRSDGPTIAHPVW